MSGAELAACPFCGEQPTSFPSGDGTGTMIHCVTNGCVNPHVSYYGDGVAVRVWNRRAVPMAVSEEDIATLKRVIGIEYYAGSDEFGDALKRILQALALIPQAEDQETAK